MDIPLKKVVEVILKEDFDFTLIGIGPMSELIVKATFELGKELDFPIMFIASRSQIDMDELGGGYVNNWNQKRFKEFIDKVKKEVGFNGLLYLCRDHGGPWQRPEEKELSYDEAIERAKKSYLEDIKNGFNFLHLDPTLEPDKDNKVPLETVRQRTIELLNFIELNRRDLRIPEISYEFGTDETSGDLTNFDMFEIFIHNVIEETKRLSLPTPTLIVGQTGTLVKMKRNVGRFDSISAKKLTEIAKKYNMGFKEHNGDYLSLRDLRLHPENKITATNVAPEFGAAETNALIELAEREKSFLKHSDLESSNFYEIISEEVIKSGRWKKWLTKEDKELNEIEIKNNPEKKMEITLTAGHYVFAHPKIVEARKKLYSNLKELGVYDNPEEVVKLSIKQSIAKYIRSFNLIGSTTKIMNKLTVDALEIKNESKQ